MKRVFRRLRTAALCLLLGVAFLPPAGWKLCVGVDGHLVFEPGTSSATPCCVSETTGGGEVCGPEDCGGCNDLALSAGAAVQGKVAPAPSLTAAALPWCLVATAILTLATHVRLATSPQQRSAPLLEHVVLRC
jgi:hypothetical protein